MFLQFIWRSGICRWNLQVPDLQRGYPVTWRRLCNSLEDQLLVDGIYGFLAAVPLMVFSIEFIRPKLAVLWFKMNATNHNDILHTSWLWWHVQNIIVIGWAYFKLEHSKLWSNFEFDQNVVSGTAAWSSGELLWLDLTDRAWGAGRCHHRQAGLTPAQYECAIYQVSRFSSCGIII